MDEPQLAEAAAAYFRDLQTRICSAFEVLEEGGRFTDRPWSRPPGHRLQGGGLIVRSYPGHSRLNDWLRIAVRSPEEDDRLLRRLDGFR